jgi:glycosyltransferase involved in cell wall biosynthesis
MTHSTNSITEPRLLVSNGFSLFHLRVAAEELAARGNLAGLVTGNYPTARVKRILSRTRLSRTALGGRLLGREADVPEDLVCSLRFSETLNELALVGNRLLGGRISLNDSLGTFAMQRYAGQALQQVISRADANIYHYRAGYGYGSVVEAKRRGMVTLCDHSIAHPAVLQHLIEGGGQLPPAGGRTESRFWSSILRDIDQADHVVVNSDFVKETFLHEGWPSNRVDSLYLGVEDAFLSMVSERPEANLNGPLRLLFAGQLSVRKGAEDLLEALESLAGVDWELEICGGLDPEFSRRPILADPRIHYHGNLSRRALATRMSKAEVFVFPSRAEGSARVVFEALAAGCPVITTPNSGSIVKDGVHGLLVPPSDPQALVKAIETVFSNREKFALMGRSNARLVHQDYRQATYGERLMELYRRLLGHTSAGGDSKEPSVL